MVYTLKITPQINQAQIRYYQKSFYSTIHLLGDGGVQPTRQPIKTDPIQPNPPNWVGFYSLGGWVGLQNFFNSGSSWVWVIKFQTRQTQPDTPIYLIYI